MEKHRRLNHIQRLRIRLDVKELKGEKSGGRSCWRSLARYGTENKQRKKEEAGGTGGSFKFSVRANPETLEHTYKTVSTTPPVK